MTAKLLIVDDQAPIRMLLQELFHGEGLIVKEAANGQQVQTLLANWQPDVILLDMKLPGMNGLDILRYIFSQQRPAKVIMMTAYGELDELKEAYELGVVGHFSKPFDIGDLRRSVMQVMQGVNL